VIWYMKIILKLIRGVCYKVKGFCDKCNVLGRCDSGDVVVIKFFFKKNFLQASACDA